MKKELSQMTNEELWQLFPIVLSHHQPMWKEAYRLEESRIIDAVKKDNMTRINHIGSTFIDGLVAKPTIDILLEIKQSCDLDMLTQALEGLGYMFNAQPKNPPPHMMFLKGYTPQGFLGQVFHLHVRYPGDWDELYFRDYLQAHKDMADAYGDLKIRLKTTLKHDRDGYTHAKTEFIKQCTSLAKQEFAGQYEAVEEY